MDASIGLRHGMQRRNEGHGDLRVEPDHRCKLIEIIGGGVGIVLGLAENIDSSRTHIRRVAKPGNNLFDGLDLFFRDGSVGLRHFGEASEESDLHHHSGFLHACCALVELVPDSDSDRRAPWANERAQHSANNFTCPCHTIFLLRIGVNAHHSEFLG